MKTPDLLNSAIAINKELVAISDANGIAMLSYRWDTPPPALAAKHDELNAAVDALMHHMHDTYLQNINPNVSKTEVSELLHGIIKVDVFSEESLNAVSGPCAVAAVVRHLIRTEQCRMSLPKMPWFERVGTMLKPFIEGM